MTIKKGEEWGRPYRLVDGRRMIAAVDDADLAVQVDRERRSGSCDPATTVFTVAGGDLAVSLGHNCFDRLDGGDRVEPVLYSIDLGLVELGHPLAGDAADSTGPEVVESYPFVASVLGRRRRWMWPELVAVNAPVVDGLRLGPRAHPNDGMLDVTVGAMPWRQTGEAVRRAATGSHLPHPDLTVVRRASYEHRADGALAVTVDGRDRGRWSWIGVSVSPDAFALVLPAPIETGT